MHSVVATDFNVDTLKIMWSVFTYRYANIPTHTRTHTHTQLCARFGSLAIESPPISNANLDGLSEDGRFAAYSCDSALYELEGSTSISYDEENGWPDAPTCKGSVCVCMCVRACVCDRNGNSVSH